jgi:hypothetical protein
MLFRENDRHTNTPATSLSYLSSIIIEETVNHLILLVYHEYSEEIGDKLPRDNVHSKQVLKNMQLQNDSHHINQEHSLNLSNLTCVKQSIIELMDFIAKYYGSFFCHYYV